jgi:6-phosphogluconolactonase
MLPRKIATPLALLPCLIVTLLGCSGGSSGGGGSSSGPAVTLSATSLTFTGINSGYPTAAQTITLTNTGNAPLILNTEQLSGTDDSFFGGVGGGVGGCSDISLAPSASCKTEVVFTPIAARSYTATLTFTDSSADSPQTVKLAGNLAAASVPTALAKHAYVADGEGGIYSYNISSAGAWTSIGSPIGVGDTVGAMVIDPLGKFLFVAGFLTGDPVVFNINQTTGALSLNNSVLASNNNNRPENIAIDPTGTFLYISNTGIGTVDEYTVNRSTGALKFGKTTSLPLYPRLSPGEEEPSALITDPTGKYLYVSLAGYVAQFDINSTTGAITPQATPTVDGFAYYNLHLDSTGKYLYGTPGIYIYSLNPSTGSLTEIGGPIPTGQGDSDIGLTFNSTFAYVTNDTDGTLSLYSDNASTGYLTPLSSSPFSQNGNPYQILVDPGDGFAYVLLGVGDIEVMQINQDGTLSHFNSVSVASSAAAMQIYPTHP